MNSILLSMMIVLILEGALSAFENVKIGTMVVVSLGLILLGYAVRRRFQR
jgi:hypothetical protein